jgi:hypothetical protein
MLNKLSLLFGLIFLTLGILGFIPGVTPEEHMLGIFHVNAAHNVVHILTGLVALTAGFAGEHAAKVFFRIFGVVYGLVAVLGFVYGDRPILGVISSNSADTWLHVGIAAVALFLGFIVKESTEPRLREKTV